MNYFHIIWNFIAGKNGFILVLFLCSNAHKNFRTAALGIIIL